jgi:hypothetical protein
LNRDPTKESSYLVPVGANILYGDGMSFKLRYRSFKWCSEDEIRELEKNLKSIPDDNDHRLLNYLTK